MLHLNKQFLNGIAAMVFLTVSLQPVYGGKENHPIMLDELGEHSSTPSSHNGLGENDRRNISNNYFKSSMPRCGFFSFFQHNQQKMLSFFLESVSVEKANYGSVFRYSWEAIKRVWYGSTNLVQSPLFLRYQRVYAEELQETKKNPKIRRILVIDGGGIRGAIPARILTRMEEDLSSKDKGLGRPIRIAECFDLIAGTSTGGIIALGLNVPDSTEKPRILRRPKYSASKLLEIYKGREGRDIFPQPGLYQRAVSYVKPKYLQDPLETVLRSYFGSIKISKSISRVFITSYAILENRPFFFTSHFLFENGDKNFIVKRRQLTKNFFMRDVARATSAAPTYFKGAEITDCSGKDSCHVDGGVAVNNPTVAAILEARRMFPDATRYVVLSLGTGQTPSENYWKDIEDAGKIQWAPVIPDMMMNGAAKLVDHQTEELQKEFEKYGVKIEYVRLQPTLAPGLMELDNADPKKLDKLISEADEEYEKKKPKIMQIVSGIKQDERLKLERFEKMLEQDPSNGWYKLGMLKLKQNNIPGAKSSLQRAADRGHVKASYRLAQILEYEFDQSPPPYDSWHRGLLRRKFSGNLPIFEEIASNFGAHDLAAASAMYYFKITQQPNAGTFKSKAQYHIYELYSKAISKLKHPLEYDDLKDGEPPLRAAADSGHRKAQLTLAMELKKREKENELVEVETYLKSSSEAHYSEAQFQLAEHLKQKGKYKECEDLYKKAALQGHTKAKYAYALLLESKIQNEKNPSEAQIYKDQYIKFLLSAARDGDINAQYRMGEYWEREYRNILFGGTPEREQAKEWFKKAADQGHKEAMDKLAKL